MKKYILFALFLGSTGCATITNDPMTPIALTLSDGSRATCVVSNKRGLWQIDIPSIASVRRSDDVLKYSCETGDGRSAHGAIPSTMGGKIVASAVFLDLGIVDSITDKHREYPASYVIPINPAIIN